MMKKTKKIAFLLESLYIGIQRLGFTTVVETLHSTKVSMVWKGFPTRFRLIVYLRSKREIQADDKFLNDS